MNVEDRLVALEARLRVAEDQLEIIRSPAAPHTTSRSDLVTAQTLKRDSTARGVALAEEQLGCLTLGGFLREVCEKNSVKEALVFYPPAGPVIRLTYAQLWQEAFAVARALVARGLTKQTRVGLLCTNRPEWITAMFGIALAGGTGVLLSTFAKGAELEYQLRVADVSLLIFERSLLERDFAAELAELCPELAGPQAIVHSSRLPFLRRAVCIGEAPTWGPSLEAWPDFLHGDTGAPAAIVEPIAAAVAPTDQGLVLFSSGSTAKPKAVLHSHRGAVIQCWRMRQIFAVDPDVRTWAANGFFWSGNFATAMGMTLAAGGCLILQRFFAPGETLRLLQAEKVTLPVAWPHQWARLLEHPDFQKADLSALRYVGATSLARQHPTVKTDWQEPLACYGNTETFTLSTAHPSGTPPSIADGNHGAPLPGNTIRIVDPLSGEVLKRGDIGEIAVKGPTLMLGYLRMAPEDLFDEEGYFRTGDGGYVDADDRLHWQGRLNDIIKTGGANVSPAEINSVLIACPGVKVAATVGVPHGTLGEMVVACIVPIPGAILDEGSVRAFVSKRLSSYKVPRRVLFLAESDLELTGTNKVKTAPLRQLATLRLATSPSLRPLGINSLKPPPGRTTGNASTQEYDMAINLTGKPSDELPEVLATGTSDVSRIYVSLSARDPQGRDAAYFAWHSLDHRPEQYRLRGLRHSLRLVSTPACRAARAASNPRFDAVDHVMTYFFAEDAAFDQFAVLSDALMGDRRTFAMPSVEQHYFTLTGRVANPKAIAGADVIPWRPARGVYLIIEQGAESPAVLTDIDGIAGLWWHDGAPPPALSTGLKDNTGLRATYCFLDGDPVRTGELLREPLQKRWATGNIKPLLAAPFQTLIPFEWDRYLP